MLVNVEIKSGREWVKRGMLSTMGVTPLTDSVKFESAMSKVLAVATFESLLLGRHSPIEEFEVWIDAIVPERVHTHVVRHKELGKYVATSRPDISYMRPLEDGERSLSLRINAKRLIEISWQRRCFRAWKDTRKLFDMIEGLLIQKEPAFTKFLKPSCVWFGACVETHPDNKCEYYKTKKAMRERIEWISITRGAVPCMDCMR